MCIRDRVRADISEGISLNESVQEISVRVEKTFVNARSRSLTIARTEVSQSAGSARNVGMQEEGLSKKWLTSHDKEVRTTHKQFESLGKRELNFDYGGGINLKFPGDMDCTIAGEVINCRCVNRALKT
jgi:hypothetical protein